MPNHKLYKNVCFEEIHSVVQQIMISQTDLTVRIYIMMTITGVINVNVEQQ